MKACLNWDLECNSEDKLSKIFTNDSGPPNWFRAWNRVFLTGWNRFMNSGLVGRWNWISVCLGYLVCSTVLGVPVPGCFDEDQTMALLVKTMKANTDSNVRRALLKGMLNGLEGRRDVPVPNGWSELNIELAKNDDVTIRELAAQLSQIFGDPKAIENALRKLRDPKEEASQRRAALVSLLDQKNIEASGYLEVLMDDPDLCLDAIRGYAVVENATAPTVLLGRYSGLKPGFKRAIIETLASRETYAKVLLDAIKRKKIPLEDIPAHAARSMNDLLGAPFTAVFGEVRQVHVNRQKLLDKYKRLLTDDAIASANASRGRAVFNKTCASCHLMYGEGGKIGPDLTGSNRANLDYILLNSVDPSYDVPDGYKTVMVLTIDGRHVNGVLAEEDESRIVLKTVEQPRMVIAKEDIAQRKLASKSMMPEGQLDHMKDQEVVDLIRYLRSTEQVEMTK